mgnify:CR=1 FL=1
MSRDHPDGTSQTTPVEIVGSTVIPALPGQERIISWPARKITSSTTTVEVVRYTNLFNAVALISEIAMTGDNLPNIKWALNSSAGYIWQELTLPSSLTLPLPDFRLALNGWVAVEARSVDGSQITAWASIVGKEVGT